MRQLLFSLLLPSFLLLTACTNHGEVISTDGSTSMEKVMGALIESYHVIEPSVTINHSGTGSGAGIEAVLSGICDIGLSSRPLTESEIAQGAQAHLIALDAIAVILHPDNPITNLTSQQIAQIFTGGVSSWSQLGGNETPIAVYGREAGSGTRRAFEDAIGIRDLCQHTNEYNASGDIVGNIASNPNGIGYVSLASINNRVKVVSIDSVACSAETIFTGIYPLQRPFLMVTNAQTPLSPNAKLFLDYALSDRASSSIALAGVIPPTGISEN